MSSPEQSSSDLEEYSSNSKRRRITSTPEPQATGNVLLENYNIPSPSPSASTVYEFPVSGDCIDRTIEIGSSGEEHSDAESFAGELIFPSDDDDIGDDCSDDAMLFPSDLEEDDTTVTPPTPGVATSSKSNDSETDVQENLADVGHTLVSGCCQQQCLLSLTPKAVLTIRGKLGALKPSEKKQWITDKVFESSKVSTSCRGKLETNFVLSGVNVCTTAWCKVVQVKEKQLSRISSNVAQGFLNVQHGNKGRKRNNTTSDVAKTWMERYFHLVGDKMPHNDQIHLPSWETQKDVFQRYSSDMAEQQLSQEDTVSLSTFYRIWTECFPKVVIPEENRFAKCDICVKVKLERKECVEKSQQNILRTKLQEHLKRVETERKKYHHHRDKARSAPDKHVCVIIDGMDQAKTNLPNTKLIAKSTSGLWRLRTHVTGVLVHTRAPHGKLAFAFVDLLQFPHDSNLTLTLLLRSLVSFCQEQQLPENLYIQMDNTSRENKNRYVLAFCALLVKLKIFSKVQLNFLPVGHTHEDVDQLFSKIGEEIRHTGCESLPELLQAVQRSYTPNPVAQEVESVWDIKKWLEPHIPRLEQHSRYLVYRFTLLDGKTQLHYKRFSNMPWEPTGNGLTLLYGSPAIEDAPDLVRPCANKLDPEHLIRDLPKYKPYISASSWQHWEEFLSNLDNIEKVQPQLSWPLTQLYSASIVASTRRKNQEPPAGVTPATMTILDKETAVPPPVVAKPKRGQKASPENTPDPATLPEITPGSMVACFLPQYRDEIPQIGKLLVTNEKEVKIEWWIGTYTGTWRALTKRKGRSTEPWTETLPKSCILHQVSLTKYSKLPKAEQEKLRKTYLPLLADNNDSDDSLCT